MHTSSDISTNPQHGTPGMPGAAVDTSAAALSADLLARGDYRIIRRNGAVVAFEPSKIKVAMTKAFLAVAAGRLAPYQGRHDIGRQAFHQFTDARRHGALAAGHDSPALP